jgi:hypothetical protein
MLSVVRFQAGDHPLGDQLVNVVAHSLDPLRRSSWLGFMTRPSEEGLQVLAGKDASAPDLEVASRPARIWSYSRSRDSPVNCAASSTW